MIQYRKLKKEDVKQVQRVALETWKFAYKTIYNEKTIHRTVKSYYSDKSFKELFARIRKGNEMFLIALDGKRIIGYAHIGKKGKYWELRRTYVLPLYLRKGIGTALAKRVEQFMKKRKAKKYIVYPHTKNKIAKNFYLKIGFKRYPKLDQGSTSPCYIKEL